MIFAGQVVGKVLPSAKTEVSRDGNALVVHRFDVNDQGHSLGGMEDFCALLGLCPAAKYETTWERIARAVRDHAPGNRQYETFRRFAATSLLTYAVRNADCHAKNLALLYTAGNDVHLSPVYDFLTTTFYASYQYNPPGIGFMGKKSWTPGQTLPRFIAGTFGIPVREQTLLVEAVSDAVPLFQEKMAEHADFRDNGERMLLAWQDGVHGLREKRVYAGGEWPGGRAFAFSIRRNPPLDI